MFLLHELETFKNCKEEKHIVIMIIAVIYIFFLSYVIFIQQLKITFRKSAAPFFPEKIHFPLKIKKVQENVLKTPVEV